MCARQDSEQFTVIAHFIFMTHYPHFIDKENEAERGKVTCPNLKVVELGSESGHCVSSTILLLPARVCVLGPMQASSNLALTTIINLTLQEA